MRSVRDKLTLLVVVLLCTLAGLSRDAAAQPNMPGNRIVAENALQQPIVLSRRLPLSLDGVRWGWTGLQLTGGVHNPVRITLSSGSNAVAGVVTLVYPQDGSQTGRVSVPFSTTPNVGVTVELQAAPAIGTSQMRLEIVASGRMFRIDLDSQIATTSEEVALPSLTNTPMWAVMGPDLSLDLTPTNAAQPSTGDRDANYWDHATTPTIPASRFPNAWVGYECVDGVIARQRDLRQLSATQREALRTWLERGGRMVLLLDEVGDDWRELLPTFMPDDLLIASEVQRVSISESVRGMLRGAYAADPEEWSKRVRESGDSLAAPIRTRLLTLSDEAIALGWDPTLTVDARSEVQADWDRTCIAATGPVGLGLLSVLGTDPANLPEQVSAKETMTAWRNVLDLTRDQTRHVVNQYTWWDAGSDDAANLGNAADTIVQARAPGVGFFVIVMIAILLLALWVGPVGRVILKKRGLLSRSWAIALAAIAVCTLIGLLAPRLFREGTDDLGTLTLHDVFVDADGRPIRVYTSQLTAVFAGSPHQFDIAKVDIGRDDAGGQWWRGVSPVHEYWNVKLKPGASVTLVNTPAARGTLAAGVMEPIDASQWTLRMFMGVHPGRSGGDIIMPRVRVRVRRDAADLERRLSSGAIDVEVDAQPELGLAQDCTLRFASASWNESVVSQAGETRVHRFRAASSDIDNAAPDARTDAQLPEEAMGMLGMSKSAKSVIGRLTSSGDYAAVTLIARTQNANKQLRTIDRTMYRIIAPVMAKQPSSTENER